MLPYLEVFEKFGVSLAMLLFILVIAYRAICWLGGNVLLPLQKRHFEFIDRLESSLDKIISSQQEAFTLLSGLFVKAEECKLSTKDGGKKDE